MIRVAIIAARRDLELYMQPLSARLAVNDVLRALEKPDPALLRAGREAVSEAWRMILANAQSRDPVRREARALIVDEVWRAMIRRAMEQAQKKRPHPKAGPNGRVKETGQSNG